MAFPSKKFFRQTFIEFSNVLEPNVLAHLLSFVTALLRNFDYGEFCSKTFIGPQGRFHIDQVHNAFERIFGANRNLNGNGVGTEFSLIEFPTHGEVEAPTRSILLIKAMRGT